MPIHINVRAGCRYINIYFINLNNRCGKKQIQWFFSILLHLVRQVRLLVPPTRAEPIFFTYFILSRFVISEGQIFGFRNLYQRNVKLTTKSTHSSYVFFLNHCLSDKKGVSLHIWVAMAIQSKLGAFCFSIYSETVLKGYLKIDLLRFYSVHIIMSMMMTKTFLWWHDTYIIKTTFYKRQVPSSVISPKKNSRNNVLFK